jgi:drug/metabolite transporter (DMT)-like permease
MTHFIPQRYELHLQAETFTFLCCTIMGSAFSLANRNSQFIILLVLGATWGSSFILMKKALGALNVVEVAEWRLVFASLGLLPLTFGKWKEIPRKSWIYLALTGILGSGLPAFLFVLGISRIDSSLAGIINATTPLFTLLVGFAFFNLRFGSRGLIGILTGLAGTIYLILMQGGLKIDAVSILYALFPLLGAMCYGFSTNIIKSKLQHLSAIRITSFSLPFAGVPAAIALTLTPNSLSVFSDKEQLVSLGYTATLGLVCTSIAVIVFNYLIRHTTVLFASSVTYLIPVFALLWGWMFGESINIHTFMGMGVIFLGVFIVNKR